MPTGRPGDGSRGWIDGREGVARDEKGSLKTRCFILCAHKGSPQSRPDKNKGGLRKSRSNNKR